uniref:(northern house mosquito) hypothetical protein n=1 Tax=Culex pipiens TaxID=7175 RepID=A0A8D8L8G7_CULPI
MPSKVGFKDRKMSIVCRALSDGRPILLSCVKIGARKLKMSSLKPSAENVSTCFIWKFTATLELFHICSLPSCRTLRFVIGWSSCNSVEQETVQSFMLTNTSRWANVGHHVLTAEIRTFSSVKFRAGTR